MIGTSYFSIHLLALIVPGWAIVRLFRFQVAPAVLIPASGYVFYAVLAALSKGFDWSITTFLITYLVSLLVLIVMALRYGETSSTSRLDRYWLFGFGVVVVFYSLYRSLAGPYSELPADLYHHLEFARLQFDAIKEGHLGIQQSFVALLNQEGGIWYSFFSLITFLMGQEFSDTLPWATLANGLVFLSVVYSFAWYLFGQMNLTQLERCIAAISATFFLASHMGLNVFAYIRYYSFAPTMLSMVIYFAAMVALIELLKWKESQIRYALFITLCMVSAAVIHMQEALYIGVMGGLVLVWFAFFKPQLSRYPDNTIRIQRKLYYRIALVLLIAAFLALEFWVYTHASRPTDFANKIIQLSEQGPIFNRILYLNPAYQAIQVITVWGLMVYGLFVIYWRRFIVHPYLFAGMFIPLVTVFNPVFVDWFLRMDGAHTLWRMLYIVPIYFVGGLLLVFLYSSIRDAKRFWHKSLALVGMLALFLLLLPIPGLNSNSRLTLGQVDHDEGYPYWQDMIDYLNGDEVPANSILTDPVTGYMLIGLTKHKTYQHKFTERYTRKFNFDHYDDAPLKQYKGWLLIINDRDGGHSETGETGGHWPANILQTSSFYSTPLREHIERNPEQRFNLLWEKDGVRIFRIE